MGELHETKGAVDPAESKILITTPLIAPDDEKSKKIAARKFRVKILMAMQLGIQLLGILYIYAFGGFSTVAGVLFAMSVPMSVSAGIVGMLGLRRNDVPSLHFYCGFSETATVLAVNVVLSHSSRFMQEKESKGLQTTATMMGMDPIDFYAYCYFLLAFIVEPTQAFTTGRLILLLSPPKGNEVLPIAKERSK